MLKTKVNSSEIYVTEKTKMLDDRTIIIDSAINSEVATTVVSQIVALSKVPAPINILVNSPGGSITDGLAIIDCMEKSPCHINTIVNGMAASMAAIIVAAGDTRYCSPRSELMIHQAQTGVQGQLTDVMIVAQHCQHLQNEIAHFLSKRTCKTVNTIQKLMNRDSWLTAKEALDLGLIDEVSFPLIKEVKNGK